VIVGLGIDAVEVERVARLLERHGERLLGRCFEPGEARRPRDPQHVAGLLAAKEATFKALGTGWGDGVGWRDVVVVREPCGQPGLRLVRAAAARAARLGAGCLHLSITHDGGLAVAVVILEGAGEPELHLPPDA